MSGFLSSKYLKYRGKGAMEKIEDDLPCRGCGYNLRGLNYGRNCPECGTAIEREATMDVLLAGDAAERGSWRLGLAIAFSCVAGAVVARLVAFGAAIALIDLQAIYVVTGLVLSILWVPAAWMTTPGAIAKRWPRMAALRWYVRISAVLFPVAYVCLLVSLGAGAAKLVGLARLLRLLAGIGVIVLAYMLARIAMEAERETAARRLNAAVWLLPITTFITQLFGTSIFWGLVPVLGLFLFLWAWVMVLFALGILELQRHVSWTVILAERQHSRNQRVTETRREMERDLEASIRPLPPPRPDIPFDTEDE